jgi:hypothetical protein
MDSGLIVRPTGSAVRTGTMRRGGAVRSAIVTDLATSQTVTAAPDAHMVRNDTARSAPDEAADVAKIILDAQSREVIYRSVDEQPGQIARQVPQEALLRLKAYTRAEPEDAPDIRSLEKIV